MKLKNGLYNGKELCEMFEIDNNKFKNNVDTYLNKISQYCTIEPIGRGKGRKYIVSDVNEYKEYKIDFSIRIDKGKERDIENGMCDLYKKTIMYYLLNSDKGKTYATFSNWVQRLGLVEEVFEEKNREYIDLRIKDQLEFDFFQKEVESMRTNFVNALDKLEKEKVIRYFKVLMFVPLETNEDEEDENNYHRIATDDEMKRYFDLVSEINKKYAITNRYDLLYGNKEKEIKANFKLLSEYDRELKRKVVEEFNCRKIYTAYCIYLINDFLAEEYAEKYLSDFNLEFTKDSIYYKRLKRCEIRQQIVLDEVKKIEQRLAFGTVSMFLIGKDDVYMSKYKKEYVDEWKKMYKMYIYKGMKG